MNAPFPTGTAAHCHRCGTVTMSGLLPLGRHIGNVCCDCRATRKGKPFASRAEFDRLTNHLPMPPRAEGRREESHTLR
jgi:hypothetical protein